jgi:hypothetical protein
VNWNILHVFFPKFINPNCSSLAAEQLLMFVERLEAEAQEKTFALEVPIPVPKFGFRR